MPPPLAVLIDADNISPGFAPVVFAHVATLGTPIVKRAYGRPSAMTGWMEAIQDELYECRPQPSVIPGKNGTDIALAIDAMDILHAGVAQAFCIVSNDRDFVPLAVRLREAGKKVHAVCCNGDPRYDKAFDSVKPLKPHDPIVEAFRKIVTPEKQEFGLAEVGKLLREVADGIIPPPGKGRLRKALEATGQFAFLGSGPTMRVKLAN